MAAAPLRPETPPPNPSDVLGFKFLDARMSLLEAQVGLLQEWVDRQGERWADHVIDVVHSSDSAVGAAREYDVDWFRSLPYSMEVRAKIARALHDAARAFTLVNVSAWAAIAADPQGALFDGD